ncbi:hypothetical protein D3C71_1753690 [compost metagenome]
MKTLTSSRAVSGVSVVSIATPATKKTADSSMMLRKLVRDVSWPPSWAPTTEPIIIGIRIRPEFVAEPPNTPCTKIGKYTVATIKAEP